MPAQAMNPFPQAIHFDNAGMIDGKRNVILTRPFTAITSYGRITAHKGFVFDGASIPRIAHSLVGHPFDCFLEDCCIHDWLYSPYNDDFDRAEADWILKETMWNRRDQISGFKREAIYRAVRMFGWTAFKGRQNA
jgi:hypothetical protein